MEGEAKHNKFVSGRFSKEANQRREIERRRRSAGKIS